MMSYHNVGYNGLGECIVCRRTEGQCQLEPSKHPQVPTDARLNMQKRLVSSLGNANGINQQVKRTTNKSSGQM